MKILDEEKATRIFSDHDKMPYLMVENGDEAVKIYAPEHSRHHSTPIQGRIYALFFPNTGDAVKSGSSLYFVLGRKKLGPIQVQ
ncbi:MAG: hypothetical protein R2856_27095 [Caldilineaceae bacterium]